MSQVQLEEENRKNKLNKQNKSKEKIREKYRPLDQTTNQGQDLLCNAGFVDHQGIN